MVSESFQMKSFSWCILGFPKNVKVWQDEIFKEEQSSSFLPHGYAAA